MDERPAEAAREPERLRAELVDAVRAGRGHELVPFTGQSAGPIRDVRRRGRDRARHRREAEAALRAAAS